MAGDATVRRRRMRLLIPDRDGASILLDRGALPCIDVDLDVGETTTGAAWRELPTVGLAGPVLDCLVDQTATPADGPVVMHAALVELATPPEGWRMPREWTWTPLPSTSPTIEPGLSAPLDDRLAELRGERPVPANRAPWAAAGWYARAREWIERVLDEAGRAAPTAVVQFRHWGISAVMRVDTPDGRLWFKAAFGPFLGEPAITDVIHRAVPGQTAPVVAIDTTEAWMLLADLPGTVVGEDRTPTRAAFDRLARMQLELGRRTDELLAAGCPHRPIGLLPDQLRSTLTSPLIRDSLSLTPGRIDELIGTLCDAVAAVEAIGIADTFVHGDFHPGNAIETDDGVFLFDWSDAAISHPLVDAATWASWFAHDPEHVAAVWRTSHEARSAVDGSTAGLGLGRVGQRTLEAVAGAYHLISYAGILDSLEPNRRSEHADGVTEFFSLLDAAAQPSAG